MTLGSFSDRKTMQSGVQRNFFSFTNFAVKACCFACTKKRAEKKAKKAAEFMMLLSSLPDGAISFSERTNIDFTFD